MAAALGCAACAADTPADDEPAEATPAEGALAAEPDCDAVTEIAPAPGRDRSGERTEANVAGRNRADPDAAETCFVAL